MNVVKTLLTSADAPLVLDHAGIASAHRACETIEARWAHSITQFDRGRWNKLAGTSTESHDYLRACEAAPPPDFTLSAIGATRHDGLCAGFPVFASRFRLDLLLPQALRRFGGWLHARHPGFSSVNVWGAGSPHLDELQLAFDSDLPLDRRRKTLDTMTACLEARALESAADIICLKNISNGDRLWADPTLRKRGYAPIASLPLAVLDVPESEDAYISSLSPKMRRSLRQKIKKASCIRIEARRSVDGVEDQLAELREATRRRAGASYEAFEGVSPGYYRAVLEALGDRSRLLLYWKDDVLLGFSLILIEPYRIKEKYSGLRYPEALDYSIFYLNWMTILRMCMDLHIPHMHAGETTYITKVRLGCRLERSWIYFRHRRPLINWLLQRLAPFAALDANDPDLASLGGNAPYAGIETMPPPAR